MADKVILKNEYGSVTSRDDGTARVESQYGSATIHADGSSTVEGHGVKIEVEEDGTSRAQMDTINKVAIDNVIDLESYTIKHGADVTSHHIVYRGGGEVRLTYRSTGKLLEFRTTGGLAIQFSPEGVVTIQKAAAAAAV